MGLMTVNELSGLGGPGWYGTHAPARSFHEGARLLGRTRMSLVWSHRRPAGFWASARGQGWKRVSPGNLTPAMLRALLNEIRRYEDQANVEDRWRMTSPGRARPRPAPRLAPKPRPTPEPKAPKTLVSVAAARRAAAFKPAQQAVTYARTGMSQQARSGVAQRPTPWSSTPVYVSAR